MIALPNLDEYLLKTNSPIARAKSDSLDSVRLIKTTLRPLAASCEENDSTETEYNLLKQHKQYCKLPHLQTFKTPWFVFKFSLL